MTKCYKITIWCIKAHYSKYPLDGHSIKKHIYSTNCLFCKHFYNDEPGLITEEQLYHIEHCANCKISFEAHADMIMHSKYMKAKNV